MGYHRAGFEVVGVDIKQQKNYPFEFHLEDALEYPLDGFDVVHASPPCQAYSQLKGLCKTLPDKMIDNIRDRIMVYHRGFYVIENVRGAKKYLLNPTQLCGSMFGLGVWRHRLFETWPPIESKKCNHKLVPFPIDVTGTGGPSKKPRTSPGGGLSRKPKNIRQASDVMGIDWMTRKELNESIPPAYTEYIGRQLMEYLNKV
jgi:DNA (cytosine-5)-methyltransferase 1